MLQSSRLPTNSLAIAMLGKFRQWWLLTEGETDRIKFKVMVKFIYRQWWLLTEGETDRIKFKVMVKFIYHHDVR
jgi:hypothetical protein